MKRVLVALPDHIKEFLDENCESTSGLIRSLVVNYYRESNLSIVAPTDATLKILKIDLENDTIQVAIDENIRRAMGIKTKKAIIRL